jgi:predicted nucleotidyltransferase
MTQKKLFKQAAQKYVATIKKHYKPEKIFIFGSFANGKIRTDSDLDFFIVKNTRQPRRERQREVSRLLRNREVPVDILVFTPAETAKRTKLGDPFILDILNSGKLVYAKKQ